MTDPRPRPQYGEYAPVPPAQAGGGIEPAPVEPTLATDVSLNAQYQRNAAAGLTGPPAVPERKRRLWDAVLTATLLFLGVADVVGSFGAVANLGPVLSEGLAAQGVDSFSSEAIAAEAGAVANVLRIIVLVLTIVIALIQLQHNRLAFWIPIVGAAVATTVLMVAIFAIVLSDPGFIAYVESMQS